MEPFRIGIAGLGTVGAGVVSLVQAHGAMLAEKAGRSIAIAAVSARNRDRDRDVDLSAYAWQDDPVALGQRADVDCVDRGHRRLGWPGEGARRAGDRRRPARRHREQGIDRASWAGAGRGRRGGRHGAALRGGGGGRHSGAEGAGRGARRQRRGPRLRRAERHLQLHPLRDGGAARRLIRTCSPTPSGLAMPRPTRPSTLTAIDAAHKLAILAALAFGTRIDFEGVVCEGIGRITLDDIATARDMGFSIKLLALARLHTEGLEQRVRPCMVDERSIIGALPGVTNAVVDRGRLRRPGGADRARRRRRRDGQRHHGRRARHRPRRADAALRPPRRLAGARATPRAWRRALALLPALHAGRPAGRPRPADRRPRRGRRLDPAHAAVRPGRRAPSRSSSSPTMRAATRSMRRWPRSSGCPSAATAPVAIRIEEI